MAQSRKDVVAVLTVFVLGMAGDVARSGLDLGLVAHWEFDESRGVTARDSSGNGYDGTVVGGKPKWARDGMYGGCLDFDGTYGVQIPADVFGNTNQAITVSMWLRGRASRPTDRRVLLQASAEGNQESDKVVSVYADWVQAYIEFSTGYARSYEETWRELTPGDWSGRWNHYVFITDTVNEQQLIYHNGKLVKQGTADEPLTNITSAFIGMAVDEGLDKYVGRLDDVRVYSRALSADEVAELYEFDPCPEVFRKVAEEAESLITNKPGAAIALLESKLAELSKWTKENQQSYVLPLGELGFDLRFLLTKARQASGFGQEEVEVSYAQAFEKGSPSLSGLVSAMHWLWENDDKQRYEQVINSLLRDDRDYLKHVVARAKVLQAGDAEAAVRFLEASLAAFVHWQDEHPYRDLASTASLPAVYFQLATAQEAVGAAKSDVSKAYRKTFCVAGYGHTELQSAALLWLLTNNRIDDYSAVMSLQKGGGSSEDDFRSVLSGLVSRLKTENDWATFERLLNAFLSDETYPFEGVSFIESCIGDLTDEWAEKYFSYLECKVTLRMARDSITAERHAAMDNYSRAAQVYMDITRRCGQGDDKNLFEFLLCKYLFEAGMYRQAASSLTDFVSAGEPTPRHRMKEAVLMKGRCHVRLGQVDGALDELLKFAVEYPEAAQIPEAFFYIGYCYMLDNKFTEAVKAFNVVLREYPESRYAIQAQRSLTRIKDLTEQ
jgi:tetratricopeptide (TPR) repeat protein